MFCFYKEPQLLFVLKYHLMYIKPNSIFLSDNKEKVYDLYRTRWKKFAKTKFSFVKIETVYSFDS